MIYHRESIGLAPIMEEHIGPKVAKLWETRDRALKGAAPALSAFAAAGISREHLDSIKNCQDLVFQIAQASTDRVSNRIAAGL